MLKFGHTWKKMDQLASYYEGRIVRVSHEIVVVQSARAPISILSPSLAYRKLIS
jgi:hypothetical protein